MSESFSQRFIAALEPQRDRLYSAALSLTATPAAAEALLQKTFRASLQTYSLRNGPADFDNWIHTQLSTTAGIPPQPGETIAEPMPADTWARLAAGIQLEAAKSGAAKALNPDSVLNSPDPLLAPKKRNPQDDPLEGLNLSPTSRFVLAVTIALVLGISLSLYYCTRTVPAPTTKPATTSAK